ncbi:MAG: 5-methyltetrahydrofolate--homocysteine methyltransferase [Lentisphaerae bacterium]|nr:5-methyltetrahydrofolate--homocysteine methyltransferase [Lentisphaerota bacterium]
MTRENFKLLASKGLLLDGATGTELIKLGMPSGVSPELWVYEHPEAINSVHDAYFNSGSDIVYAPTFGGNRCKMAEFGLADRMEEIIGTLMRRAKAHAGEKTVFGDIAPTGRFVEPYGELPFEEAVAIFRELAAILAANGADGFAIETMMDIQEARAALLGCREAAPDLPVIVTMTFENSGKTLTGCDPAASLITMQSLGADAFGCNCSTGPAEMAEIIRKMRPFARIPLIAKPNAGLPKLCNGKTCFEMSPAAFADSVNDLLSSGVTIMGGCCGTTPEHLAAMNKKFRSAEIPALPASTASALSAPGKYREISVDQPFTVIGERINPTGKKALQAELREGKTDLLFDFAIQQLDAGAEVLDVNMGMSGIDETAMMRAALHRILKSTPAILCIDSTTAETVEAALRLYPGRALLNSISAEEKRLKQILPIAAKYGAMLILLPLTDAGLPKSGDERWEILQEIISEAKKYGYRDADFCIDALILSVSTDPNAANSALEFISRCRKSKLNTVCGLSNISFGLPNRQLVNRTFLSMAMGCGLNMAIANPLFADIMEQTAAGDALSGKDRNMENFIRRFADSAASAPQPEKSATPDAALRQAVLRGDAAGITAKIDAVLRNGMLPAEIINQILIPAITEVGDRYERKEFFLPQLIAGAEAMSCGTAYLEPMLNSGNAVSTKGKVIIATVKNDIHDIGKNIVAVILRNYGFEVIDLGKDVPAETILARADAENVKVICLSALMTATMDSMREVVGLARARGLDDLKFIIGGAVVDQNFADELGVAYGNAPLDTMKLAEKFLCGK